MCYDGSVVRDGRVFYVIFLKFSVPLPPFAHTPLQLCENPSNLVAFFASCKIIDSNELVAPSS